MPRITYIEKKFSDTKLALLKTIDEIMQDYSRQGYDLSLRQLYYQLVSRDIVPNNQREYKILGVLVNDGRLAGLLDWNQIVDRGRELVTPSHWDSPSDIIQSCATSYRIDKWAGQPCYVLVAVEKQALEGVLEPLCKKLDIDFVANKGYSSQSTMWQIGRRLRYNRLTEGKRNVVFYLGDHDPSGLDMDRDVKERLEMFSEGPVEFRRLALTRAQIDELNPPENPAKLTDSRADAYIAEHGESSWELDAIEPSELARIVTEAVNSVVDHFAYNDRANQEKRERAEIAALAARYNDVVAMLNE